MKNKEQSLSPKPRLAKEITGVLLFKLVAILLAGLTIFGATHRLHVDSGEMMAHILTKN